MLGGLAVKRLWQKRRGEAGKPADRSKRGKPSSTRATALDSLERPDELTVV